jgi:hypothetical protein
MKHDIIKTDNYLLIVSDEIPTTWYYDTYINQVRHTGGAEYGESSISKKVIGHLPLNNSPVLKGVDLLPPLEDEVEKLSANYTEEWCGKRKVDVYIHDAFKGGYNKAKEKYKYTKDDVIKIVEKSRETGLTAEYLMLSLQQPKYPIGFECEMENKIAIDGHTVIGSEPKTITNSKGQTVLVGKYIYD